MISQLSMGPDHAYTGDLAALGEAFLGKVRDRIFLLPMVANACQDCDVTASPCQGRLMDNTIHLSQLYLEPPLALQPNLCHMSTPVRDLDDLFSGQPRRDIANSIERHHNLSPTGTWDQNDRNRDAVGAVHSPSHAIPCDILPAVISPPLHCLRESTFEAEVIGSITEGPDKRIDKPSRSADLTVAETSLRIHSLASTNTVSPPISPTSNKRRAEELQPDTVLSTPKKQKGGTKQSSKTLSKLRGKGLPRIGTAAGNHDDEETEMGRCLRHGLSYHQQPWNTSAFESEVETIAADDMTKGRVRSLLKGMGDGHSLIELKRLIQMGRNHASDHERLDHKIEAAKRYSRIQNREAAISYIVLRQWIDVLCLYEECGHLEAQRKGQFAIQQNSSLYRATRKKPGNPISASESAITDQKMRRLLPDIEPGSQLWRQERKSVGRLRMYGSRLAMLQASLEDGGLCLMLLANARPITMWRDHL